MMRAWQKVAICIAGVSAACVASVAQTDSAATRDLAAKAVLVVTAKSVLYLNVLVPKTGKPLSAAGKFSVGTTRPESCPQTTDPCLNVFYRVPEADVSCEWTVLLPADNLAGQLLAENDEAARYFVLRLALAESAAFVQSRSIAQDPPIARAAHMTGDVVVRVVVGVDGLPQRATAVSGPEMLKGAAVEAAGKWRFKPCTIGGRAVRYQMEITFLFRGVGLSDSPVQSKP